MHKPLTEDDQAELDRLNAAVTAAITKRRQWLDSKMPEYASAQPGEMLYDLSTNELLGKVTRLYRYWQDRDEGVRDTEMDIDYEYETSPRCFDNTSRQCLLDVGTTEDLSASFAPSRHHPASPLKSP